MKVEHHGHEHEIEPQHGLPERLPQSECILWQGGPDAWGMARHVFRLRGLAAYFVVMLALLQWRLWSGEEATLLKALTAAGWGAGLALGALAAIGGLAWLTARTTVYTLTDKRVVMRVGIVLTVTYNLPHKALAGAELRMLDGRCGDIALALAGPERIAYLHLWPHARPWRLAQPQPMLRALPDAPRVAQQLAQAWSAVTGRAVDATAIEAAQAEHTPARPSTGGFSGATAA